MTQILRPDFCVIGGGPGGLAAARGAAGHGAKVVLVEKRISAGLDQMRIAWLTQALATAAESGNQRITQAQAPLDFSQMRHECDAAIARTAREDSSARLIGLNIALVQEAGSFTRPSRFETNGTVIEARHFLLAIASLPAAPTVPGIDLVRPLTPNRIVELTQIPERLAVIGAGAENIQLVQSFLRLGTKVILFQSHAFFGEEDAELTLPLLNALRREGLHLVDRATVSRIEHSSGQGMKIIVADGTGFDVTHLLYAPKRVPLVAGLGLKLAHVAANTDGIKHNAHFRSSNPRIHIINDGFDSFHSIATARREGEWIAQQLFGKSAPAPLQNARIIAADPEIAIIGLSEAQARERHRVIHVLRAGFSDNLRAQTCRPMRHPVTGHVKIITDRHNHILGAGIVGPQARELIGIFGLALAHRLKARDLGALAASEPALTDVCRAAALASAPQTGKVSAAGIFAALNAGWRSPR
jgi:pyruvate/2-oxoglutarate dehydrogenase complex dihydrolipoamide dehydrogenase (E3) component